MLLTLGPVGALSTSVLAAGQAPPPKTVQMEILGTDESLYLISGGGGNTLAVVDDESGGVVLIDTKRPGWGKTVADAINLVTDLPVTTIINTHAHEDHTGSNGEFPTAAQIVAHENAAAAMARARPNGVALPNRTFADRMSLLQGENRIDLYYFGAGHTNGDVVVVFPAKALAYIGDLFAAKAVPVIDRANGGSGVALPDTLETALTEILGVTKVVTGEMRARNQYAGRTTPIPGAATFGWDDLQEYADFCRDFLEAVREAYEANKTVDEATAGLTLSDRYPGYGMEHARTSVQAIYDELAR